MPGIFISYRREDTAGHAGRIFDRLKERFGTGTVFMDVAGIEPGVDFVEAIDRAVGSCDVLLVVIGKKWLSCTDASGKRRLDEPKDFIRLETATALRRGIRVIPVLVQDAVMPGEGDLPDELKKLARRQATEISDSHWDSDTGQLIEALAKLLRQESEPAPAGTGGVAQAQDRPVDKPETHAPASAGMGKNKLVWIFLAIMSAAVTLGGLLYFLPPGKDVAVPDLIGITHDEAIARLEQAHLRPGVTRPVPSERPLGTVIEQHPAPGSQLAPDSPVNLVLAENRPEGGRAAATGEEPKPPETVMATSPEEPVMVTVPDVTGREVKKAIALLKDAGLDVIRRIGEETSAMEPGTVLKQSLKPGLRVRQNEAITLIYALAPGGGEAAGKIVLPDFTGSPVRKVEDYLKEKGLVLGPIREEASSEHPAGTVIDQRPPAKTHMEKGGMVLLKVAVSAGDTALLPAPVQAWPEEGRTFDNIPRTMAVRWKPVSGAASYTVELDCLHCCAPGRWCSDLGKPWKLARGLPAVSTPGHKFEFAGAQPGRWRVWAVEKNGREGEKSPWRTFRYTR